METVQLGSPEYASLSCSHDTNSYGSFSVCGDFQGFIRWRRDPRQSCGFPQNPSDPPRPASRLSLILWPADPLPITLHPHSKVQLQVPNPTLDKLHLRKAQMKDLYKNAGPNNRGPRGGWWGRQTTDHLRNYGQEGKEGGRDVTCYKTPVNAANYTTKYPVNNLV